VRGPILVVVAILAVWAWYHHVNGLRLSSPDRSPLASPLRLIDPEGSEFALESLRGRVVLISVWASWCPPCRAEIPRLNRLAAKHGEELVVIGVNVEGFDGERLQDVSDELGIDYRVVVPGNGLAGTFAWDGLLPYTWLIDKRGRVRAGHGGLPSESSLRRACEALVKEPAS
jgi:thiol-disulfide isomerase/thioredoxin